MSGLCGILDTSGPRSSRPDLERMARRAPHRGIPHVLDVAGGAVAALNARDGEASAYADASVTVVCASRLDGREELLEALRMRDPDAARVSDAHLIAAAFREWGRSFPRRLLGDFALVLVDHRTRTLYAARDVFAMRPLYYHATPDRLALASEVKQLLALEDVEAHPSEASIGRYLAGMNDRPERTAFAEILQIPPGHLLEWSGGSPQIRPYWSWPLPRLLRYDNDTDCASELRVLFRRAVEDRVGRYERIGILLSGGTDSVAAASMAATVLLEQGEDPAMRLHAYCFDYSAFPQADEREISRMVTGYFGIPVTEIPVHEHLPLSHWPEVAPDLDDPQMGAYQQLIEAGMRRAEEDGMAAIMGGDRGDLLFGEFIYDYWPLIRRGRLHTLWDELGRHARWRSTGRWNIARRHLISPFRSTLLPLHRLPAVRRAIRRIRMRLGRISAPIPDWIDPDFAARTGLDRAFVEDAASSGSAMPRQQRRQAILSPMQMQGAAWSERTAARYGLAHLDAWSDRRLAEFALAVPQHIVNRVGEDKRLVRMAMFGIVPEDARRAMRKTYPIDVYRHALEISGKPLLEDLLSDMLASRRRYVDEAVLRRHYADVVAGAPDDAAFWRAVTVEMWLRKYDRIM